MIGDVADSNVDFEFTADMEQDLDQIAQGDRDRTEWLRAFYFGDGDGLKPQIDQRIDELSLLGQ